MTVDGCTQAASVMSVVNRNSGASGIVTFALVPLKTSAPPNLPAVVHVAPLIVPVLLWPEASVTVVPLPSLKLYAATKDAARSGKTVTVTVAVARRPARR